MGNNGSRSSNVAQRHPIEPEQQWAHSFPRNPHRVYQHKVLPEKEIGTKLRCTNNGEILQSGGTISGRHHQQTLSLEREDKSFRIFRASSITSNSPDEYNLREEKTPNRSYVSRHRGVHKYAAKRYENNNNNNVQRERMKKSGSEPDLRNPTVANHQNVVDKYKGKRKYKAPPPPNTLTVRSDPDGALSSINSSPILISSEYKNMKYKCENLMSISRGKISPISDSSDESTKKAPMTQILSEYRQQQRDYKDFRGSPRYKGKFCNSQFFRQVTTIHPQITCDMPKASTHKTDSESSANYRKQFAHGVKTNKYEDGACSDDSQSNIKNYSPKMYNNKHKPISRF